MTKVIVTFEDDKMLAHGKTNEMLTNLLKKISEEYGTVEDYNVHISKHDAEWQKRLDNMTAEYNKIADYDVNDTELPVLKAVRVAVDKSRQEAEAKCAVMEDSLRKSEEKALALANAMRTTLDAYSE